MGNRPNALVTGGSRRLWRSTVEAQGYPGGQSAAD